MLIDLSYDILVELHLLVTGRYPTALMDQIADKKVEIYQSLSADLRRSDMLSGSYYFEVEDRKFTVLFASDTRMDDRATDTRYLRVLDIEEGT